MTKYKNEGFTTTAYKARSLQIPETIVETDENTELDEVDNTLVTNAARGFTPITPLTNTPSTPLTFYTPSTGDSACSNATDSDCDVELSGMAVLDSMHYS